MEYDLHNSILQKISFPLGTVAMNETIAGEIIDTHGFESVEFIVTSRTLTDGDYAFFIEDGSASNLSDAELVPGELVLGGPMTYDSTEDATSKRVGAVSKKRYVRISVTSTNVTSGGSFSGIGILGNPQSRPVSEV